MTSTSLILQQLLDTKQQLQAEQRSIEDEINILLETVLSSESLVHNIPNDLSKTEAILKQDLNAIESKMQLLSVRLYTIRSNTEQLTDQYIQLSEIKKHQLINPYIDIKDRLILLCS